MRHGGRGSSRQQSLPSAAINQLRAAATLWRRSLALVFAAAPRQAMAMGVLMLAQAFLPVATLWASRGVVNAAAGAFGLASPAPGSSGLGVGVWIGIAVAAIVGQQLAGPLFQTAQEAAADRVVVHVNGELLAAANRWRGLARFEDPAFADRLATARRHATQSPVDLVSYGGRFVQTLFTIVAMGTVLWRVHPLAPFLLVLAHVPQALQENRIAQEMADAITWDSADGRKLDSYVRSALGLETAKDVRIFGLGGFFHGLFSSGFDQATERLWSLRRRLMRRMLPAQVLSGGVSALVYLYAVRQVLYGGFSLGDLVMFGGALLQLEGALQMAGFSVGFFAEIFTWLPSLFAVLDAGPDLPLAPHPAPAPRPVRTGLVVDHVSFRYPGTSATILRDVSFALQPGERLALVGRNGAGKTTLVKLLARLYDPSEGRILLDGMDLRDYDPDDLRRQIGVVFQDFVCYQLTAQENVGLGDIARLEELPAVRAAAGEGGAATLIEGLPRGYATRLGQQFGGVNLSGGQWQKIALSRAFMRQAQLLILDEPTAALDVQAEYDVYRRFAELTTGRMTVLVSHRFSTVRMADRIAYLEEGRVVEEGSHDGLMRRDGGYARLYRLQAELYQ